MHAKIQRPAASFCQRSDREITSIVRLVLLGTAFAISVASTVTDLNAQAVTTGTIRGTVSAFDSTSVDGARVTATNTATGFPLETEVSHGRFVIQGLEVGGPYTVTIRRTGFATQERRGLWVTLGEPVEMSIVLESVAVQLDPLHVVATPVASVVARGGTGTVLSDSLLHRLPTLNRDLYDFVRLVPQISTKVGFRWGFSGSGGNIRYNNFMINGVPERNLANATAALAGGKSIPLDAVKEYAVLVAPYDVRYGDFAGAMINSVTRSGTNRMHGSAFMYMRNDGLARREAADSASPYNRLQYGVSLGGPLVRDRLQFYVAAELQRLSSPAPGPWIGQPANSTAPVPVTATDLARLDAIMNSYGLEAGSGGDVENRNPVANIFGRLDLSLPAWNSRAVLWLNHDHGMQDFFSRNTAASAFPLSTMQSSQRLDGWLGAIQLQTALPRAGGGHNELIVSRLSSSFEWLSPVDQPIVSVKVPGTTGSVTISTGTSDLAHGPALARLHDVTVVDNLTLPIGETHLLTVGGAVELTGNTPRRGVPGSYGTWTFSSLDALARGEAERFVIRRDQGMPSEALSERQFAAYAGDQWQISPAISATFGLRADVLGIGPRAPYNPIVDSIFGRRTDELPRQRVHLSPRFGFQWDVSGTGRDRLRGGIGIFTGRPPPVWLFAAITGHGAGGVLRCGPTAEDRGPAPSFEPDRSRAPTACLTGPDLTEAPAGDVDLLDRDLQPARSLRASLAYDRRLPGDVLATGEVVVTRSTADFEFVNLNLSGPQAVDRHGRVLYGSIVTGDTLTSGFAAPMKRSAFNEVIDLRNTSRNHAWQVSARLEKQFSDGLSLLASYTRSRVRDVQTPIRTGVPGTVNWSARALSGRHDDGRTGISLNDVPHRVVVAGTARAPWRKFRTELSFYYVGESGSPFTYVAGGSARLGDLNADGSGTNDPIYIPRNASDTSEIRFSGTTPGGNSSASAQAERAQQVAFDEFIERTPCLRRQRGRHMERNSCREPWTHTTVALVRQPIPLGGHALEAEIQFFNVLDLLGSEWGQYRLARPQLLEHVAHTPGTSATAQPIFRFDTTADTWTTLESESRFQLQIALRYRF